MRLTTPSKTSENFKFLWVEMLDEMLDAFDQGLKNMISHILKNVFVLFLSRSL